MDPEEQEQQELEALRMESYDDPYSGTGMAWEGDE